MLAPPWPSEARSAHFFAVFSTMLIAMASGGNFLAWIQGYAARVVEFRRKATG